MSTVLPRLHKRCVQQRHGVLYHHAPRRQRKKELSRIPGLKGTPLQLHPRVEVLSQRVIGKAWNITLGTHTAARNALHTDKAGKGIGLGDMTLAPTSPF